MTHGLFHRFINSYTNAHENLASHPKPSISKLLNGIIIACLKRTTLQNSLHHKSN